MKVYIVEAFSAEQYDTTTWVDSVFSSLKTAQDYVNKYRDENDRPVKIVDEDEVGYFLSSFIYERDLQD